MSNNKYFSKMYILLRIMALLFNSVCLARMRAEALLALA